MKNMKNSATRLGSVGNERRISTGPTKMEEDHHKSGQKNEID